MKFIICLGLAAAVSPMLGQTTVGPVVFSGYAEAYYSEDFVGSPNTRDRQITPSGVSPVYSYSRDRELNINHALLDAKYTQSSWRGALGVQAGTYVDANYSAEDRTVAHVFEATAGVELAPALWLDAGIFSSHIGMESAIAKDNPTLTRSLVADNTPYFETGVKLTYDPNPHWTLGLLVLQGWQNIRDQNSNKPIGTLVQYKPNDGVVFNSSTFIGEARNAPGNDERRRYFHDLFITDQVTSQFSVGLQADVGFEEKTAQDHALNHWYAGSFVGRYQFSPKYAASVRAEYYHDPDGVTISTGTPGNFVGRGGSVGFDYIPAPHYMLRSELRTLSTDHAIFEHRDGLCSTSTYATASFIMWF